MNTENRFDEQKFRDLEKKFKKSSDALKYCEEDKEEFIYLAAHELKAPLRKVNTFAQLLKEKTANKLDEELLMYIQRIEKNVLQMQSMVDGLTELSEISSNVRFQQCDLNKVVRSAMRQLKMGKSKIKVTLPDLPEVRGNEFLLKKVFKNIFENSIKFNREGERAEIRIRSEVMDAVSKECHGLPMCKKYYEIAVDDEGIGFPEEEKKNILKPFVKLNGQSSYPGNGLGLAICDKIIKIHEGVFYAMGEENMGSVFVLILPKFS